MNKQYAFTKREILEAFSISFPHQIFVDILDKIKSSQQIIMRRIDNEMRKVIFEKDSHLFYAREIALGLFCDQCAIFQYLVTLYR
jgi:hypothetical protein